MREFRLCRGRGNYPAAKLDVACSATQPDESQIGSNALKLVNSQFRVDQTDTSFVVLAGFEVDDANSEFEHVDDVFEFPKLL